MKSYKMMAKVYDDLIYEDVNYENIAKYALSKCESYNISRDMYLDLACGTGNVGVYVGKSFKENYFVDLSQEMLIEADKKLREHRVRGKIVCQDMCELELNRKFDLITCVLDSTNYILDEESVENYLRGVYNHLKEDGLFIFDINSYYKISQVLGNNVYTYDSEELFYAWENIFEDEIVEMNLNFFVKDGEKYERFTEVHEERAYREEEIESILKAIGFKILEKHKGYTEDKVTCDTERIVYIVKK